MALSYAARSVGGALAASGTELAAIVDGRLVVDGSTAIRGASVDSRTIAPGQMFVALPGERTHGLMHASAALRGGATAVLVEGGEASEPLRGALSALADDARSAHATVICVEDGRSEIGRAHV